VFWCGAALMLLGSLLATRLPTRPAAVHLTETAPAATGA
jgi:hypothetical protein